MEQNTNAPPALPLSGQRLGPSGLEGVHNKTLLLGLFVDGRKYRFLCHYLHFNSFYFLISNKCDKFAFFTSIQNLDFETMKIRHISLHVQMFYIYNALNLYIYETHFP